MLTIHNMDNTGEVRQDEFAYTGLPGEMFASECRWPTGLQTMRQRRAYGAWSHMGACSPSA